ncbi:MAG: dUTP diphosphatase [Bacteroidetes bacterium]|jgi:dUTP pyrophosphatase|nr:MAG: dUTP diphosphatase [Bacteroidota bacterium]
MNTVSVKKLDVDAHIPTKAHDDDAGWDLYSNENTVIYPGEKAVIKTGIVLAIPRGYYGRIAPRSGLAVKNGIDVLAGVVDAGYRNEIGVVLINHHIDNQFAITKGDRIAQVIFERVDPFELEEVLEFFNNTDRGMGGFGSSGK